MALEGKGFDVHSPECIWVYMVAENLNSETSHEWELSCAGDELPTIENHKQFLEDRASALKENKERNTLQVNHSQAETDQSVRIAPGA